MVLAQIDDMRVRLQSLLENPACDYLEIRVEDSKTLNFAYMGHELRSLCEDREGGAAIRALVGGCWGFATVNNLDQLEAAVKQALASAHSAAKSARADHAFALAPVDPVDMEFKLEALVDPRLIPLEDKLRLFDDYNQRMLRVGDVASTGVRYFDTWSRIVFANSEGTYIDRELVDLACAVSAIARRNGITRQGVISNGSTNNFNLMRGLEREAEGAAHEAVAKLAAPVIDAGVYTVICDPHLTGVFVHEAFGHLSEGDNLTDDPRMAEILTLGRTFGSEHLNIYDTGLDVGLRGYLPVDDEGVPTRHTDLIVKGKLVGRLHSRETAGKLGEAATGNGRAISYRFPPIPRMRNTCIGPGPDGSFEDLIKDVKLGVYALGSSGGQTNGELFTFTCRDAFMIRDGEVAERVNDVTISGNVFDTLRNIDGISSEMIVRDSSGGCGKAGQMPLPVSHGGPHIRIRECVIGGK